MKISKLQLNAFGKFSDKQIDFKEGLNIVYGLNESGKSTIQMFILSMLFGAKKDFYIKYKPWYMENESFGGELEYKLGRDEYKIVREFSEKSKTAVKNKISEEDITENFKSSKSAEPRIIEKQLGISRQCFLKTIFCKQSEMSDVKSAKEFVAQKLMNVSESGDEELSISDSIVQLEKLRENINSNNKNLKIKSKALLKIEENKRILLEINKIEKEILKLQKLYSEKKEEAGIIQEKLKSYKERLNDIEESSKLILGEEAATISNVYRGLEKQDFEDLKNEYSKYTNNMSKSEKIKAEINSTFVEINNNKNVLNGIDNNKINEMEVEYINLCNEIATCRQQIQTSEVLIRDKINNYNNFLRLEKIKSIIKIGSIAVSSILSVILSICNLWGIIGFSLPIGLFIYALISRNGISDEEAKMKSEIEKIEDKKKHVSEELEVKEQKYNKIFNEMGIQPGEILDKLKELRRIYNRQIELDLKLKTNTINLQSTHSELEYQSKEIVKIVKKASNEDIDFKNFDNLVSNIIDEHQAVSNGLKADNKDGLKMQELSIHELNKSISELNSKNKELNLELSDIQEKINIKFEKLNNYETKDEIIYNIEKYQNEYQKEKEDLEAIDKAILQLKESRESVRAQYGQVLVNNIVKKISKITNNKYRVVNVDDIVQMNTVNEENKEIAIEGLSGGTIDQFYFSWRTALAEVMSDDHYKLPIIVDEPFAQYDDKRLEEAVEVLSDIAKERQVILFTCQKRDIEVTKNICAQKFNLIYL